MSKSYILSLKYFSIFCQCLLLDLLIEPLLPQIFKIINIWGTQIANKNYHSHDSSYPFKEAPNTGTGSVDWVSSSIIFLETTYHDILKTFNTSTNFIQNNLYISLILLLVATILLVSWIDCNSFALKENIFKSILIVTTFCSHFTYICRYKIQKDIDGDFIDFCNFHIFPFCISIFCLLIIQLMSSKKIKDSNNFTLLNNLITISPILTFITILVAFLNYIVNY